MFLLRAIILYSTSIYSLCFLSPSYWHTDYYIYNILGYIYLQFYRFHNIKILQDTLRGTISTYDTFYWRPRLFSVEIFGLDTDQWLTAH